MMEQTMQHIFGLLCSYTGESLRFSEEWAVRAGVCVSDLRALAALDYAERGGEHLSAGKLAAELGLSAPATSALLARLEAGGLLVKERDPDDGRRVRLRPTESARLEAEAFFVPMGDAVRRAAASSCADELDVVKDFLARVVHEMHRRP